MTGDMSGGNTVACTPISGNRTSETVGGQTKTFLNDPNQAAHQVLERPPQRRAGRDVYSWI